MPLHQLACRRCWRLLPRELREAVTIAYRAWKASPRNAHLAAAHRAAVSEAITWYGSQP